MAYLTLANARQTLWKYGSSVPYASSTADEKLAVDGIINQVIERFLTSGKWRGTIVRAIFNVYNNQITLPHTLDSVLGALPVSDDNENYGSPISVYSQWHEFIQGAPGKLLDQGLRGLIDLGDGFVGFRDSPTVPFYLKVISDLDETGETILVRGLDENEKQIYTAPSTEGLSIVLDNAGVTTAQQFTSLNYWVKSSSTNGIARLYAVDVTTADETLISIIAPGKTVSGYHRYQVPWEAERIEVIAKRAYVPAVSDNDQIIPGHLGALKLGMMALRYEDTNDLDRAEQFMDKAITLLDNQLSEFQGDNLMPELSVLGEYGAGSILNPI